MMALWILLMAFHLGDAPWTEVLCLALPAPTNVTISSFNMEHTLSFLPGPGTPSNTTFSVHIRHSRRGLWRPVVKCLDLSAGETCDLSRAFRDPYGHYRARVQASTPSLTSNWTLSALFQPVTDTVLEAPDFSVSGCGNCLILKLSIPSNKTALKDLYRQVVVDVKRSRDGAEFRITLPYQEESVISYLQPGQEYCVTASTSSIFTSNSIRSQPQCAMTSPPSHPSTVYVLLALLSLFCTLALLLMGLLLCGTQLRV